MTCAAFVNVTVTVTFMVTQKELGADRRDGKLLIHIRDFSQNTSVAEVGTLLACLILPTEKRTALEASREVPGHAKAAARAPMVLRG